MNKNLAIRKSDLENAQTDWDYLQVILDKYNALWKAEPGKMMENFNDGQLSFLMYGVLYNQVQNGGFLQLLFNGYAPYIFGSPLAASLKLWGAVSTADLLESIKTNCIKTVNEIKNGNLEDLSNSYTQYPEFESYDKDFYKNDGTKEVKVYVESHLNEFAMVK